MLQMTTCLNCGGAIFYGSGTIGWGGQICNCQTHRLVQTLDGTFTQREGGKAGAMSQLQALWEKRLEDMNEKMDKLIKLVEKINENK